MASGSTGIGLRVKLISDWSLLARAYHEIRDCQVTGFVFSERDVPVSLAR
jgi:hypothetical protein